MCCSFFRLGVIFLATCKHYTDNLADCKYYLQVMMKKDIKDSDAGVAGLISISEAARVRNVSHAAIQDLIKREKLSAVEIGGRRFLQRDEVESYTPESIGRPPKAKPEQSNGKKRGKK